MKGLEIILFDIYLLIVHNATMKEIYSFSE